MKTLFIILICGLTFITRALDETVKQASYQILVKTTVAGKFVLNNKTVFSYSSVTCANGVMISPKGHILTNNHVADIQSKIDRLLAELNSKWVYVPFVGLRRSIFYIDCVRLEYQIKAEAGKLYKTLYFPKVVFSKDSHGNFSAQVVKNDVRNLKNEDRQLALLYGDSTDVFILKVNNPVDSTYLRMALNEEVKDSLDIYIRQKVFALPFVNATDQVVVIEGEVFCYYPILKFPHTPSVYLLMTVRPGFSGSAVVNEQGKIVGLIWGYMGDYFGGMIPIDRIKKFILDYKHIIFPEKVRSASL